MKHDKIRKRYLHTCHDTIVYTRIKFGIEWHKFTKEFMDLDWEACMLVAYSHLILIFRFQNGGSKLIGFLSKEC